MKKSIILLMTAGAAVLSGCAMPHIVEETQTTDANLDCSSLQLAINEAKVFELQAEREKGITGTNVVAALFFYPAIAGNYGNARAAVEAAQARQEHLLAIYDEMDC